MPEEPTIDVSAPRVLRALAHPLRNALLGLLRSEGPSTASKLGQRLGQSSGSTSCHLRQLAGLGFVEEVPGGTARERYWQARHRTTHWQTDDVLDRPGGREVVEEFTHLAETAGTATGLLAVRPPSWSSPCAHPVCAGHDALRGRLRPVGGGPGTAGPSRVAA